VNVGTSNRIVRKADRRGRPLYNIKKDWCCTSKPGRLYIHFFKWPGATFTLAGLKGKVTKAYLLIGRDKAHPVLAWVDIHHEAKPED